MSYEISQIRAVILDTLFVPDILDNEGIDSYIKNIYISPMHVKALYPDVPVVLGSCGSGKSFWWFALQKEKIRQLLAYRIPRLKMFQNAIVVPGFGLSLDLNSLGDFESITNLFQQYDSYTVWRAVIFYILCKLNLINVDFILDDSLNTWSERIYYVIQHSDKVDQFFEKLNEYLNKENQYVIVVFDDIDYCANSDWYLIQDFLCGLLQVILDFRVYQRINIKLFLRNDIFNVLQLNNNSNYNKVLYNKVELVWNACDLYSLFFQYLINSKNDIFRFYLKDRFGIDCDKYDNVFILPDVLSSDEELQRRIISDIICFDNRSKYRYVSMYRWLFSHLSDAHGYVSPRSFLAALYTAAHDSSERFLSLKSAISFDSFKFGIQKAAQIRLQELQKVYSWIRVLIEPLAGKLLPISIKSVDLLWRNADVYSVLKNNNYLLPYRFDEGFEALISVLRSIGIFQLLKNDMINLPEIYRIACKMGRKGVTNR